jgi:hypothetical protein
MTGGDLDQSMAILTKPFPMDALAAAGKALRLRKA